LKDLSPNFYYKVVKELSSEFGVERTCKALGYSKTSFYRKRKQPETQRELSNKKLLIEIKRIHNESKQIFGSPSVISKLKEEGFHCNHKRVAKLMKDNNIRSKTVKKFKITTDSNHERPICPNLIKRDFKPKKINTLWCSDITYVKVGQGWLYLAVVIDLYSRKVVGWSMAETMTRQLVIDSFMMAWQGRGKPSELIYHSDRGSQYTSHDFQSLLKDLDVQQSMSRRANCWDNACAESFFASLKKEEVYLTTYATVLQAGVVSLSTLRYSITLIDHILLLVD